MIQYTPYIIQYDNVIEDEIIDEYLEVLTGNLGDRDPDIGYVDGRENKAYALCRYRDNNPDIAKIDRELTQYGFYSLFRYYEDCKLAKKYWTPHNDLGSVMTYRTYDRGDSYNWHVDSDNTMRLLVSFLLYLNDDFEGGETLFLNDRLKVKPKKGSVLFFPCGPYFIHKSTKIKSGNKHVIWNCFRDYFNPLKPMNNVG